MTTQLPLWYGRERGTDVATLVDFDVSDAAEDAGGRDLMAGILGLLVPVAIVALVMACGQLPIGAMVILGMAGAAWLTTGLAAAWLVAFSEEETPPWAEAFVTILVALGTITAIALAIASVVAVVVVLLIVIVGLTSSDRR